jgi:hypothetical protein
MKTQTEIQQMKQERGKANTFLLLMLIVFGLMVLMGGVL